MNSKADANMWWIIIGAVIALVVMIILMVIFTGKTGTLEGGLSDCEGKGGYCTTESECPLNSFSSSAFSCTDGKKCCIGAPEKCVAGTCKDENKQTCKDGYCYTKTS